MEQPIGNVMTKENLITGPVNTTLEEAKVILHKHRIEKLPLVDENYVLKGLITIKTSRKPASIPMLPRTKGGASAGGRGGGGVGPDRFERSGVLVDAGVDALVIDTAHGHSRGGVIGGSQGAAGTLWRKSGHYRRQCGHRCRCGGSNRGGGVDGIKVGIGPGSICTTRVVAGVGGYPS